MSNEIITTDGVTLEGRITHLRGRLNDKSGKISEKAAMAIIAIYADKQSAINGHEVPKKYVAALSDYVTNHKDFDNFPMTEKGLANALESCISSQERRFKPFAQPHEICNFHHAAVANLYSRLKKLEAEQADMEYQERGNFGQVSEEAIKALEEVTKGLKKKIENTGEAG